MNRLFEFSIVHSSPYRIGRIRNIFEGTLFEVKSKYEIKEFSSQNYKELFGADQKLELLISEKRKAITAGDYELAATLRDGEKRILRSLLLSIGVSRSDQFFTASGQIYKIV